MTDLLDSPFAATVLACIAVAVAFAGAGLLTRSRLLADLGLPATFLAAYYETYQKIPGFPPVGSTNKIFYIAPAATLLGLLLEYAPARVRPAALLAVPLLAAAWIAVPRLADADAGLYAVLAALVIGGALALWRLTSLAAASPPEGGPMLATALFAVLAGGFAPIALFGGSSTSVGLCLGLAVGAAIIALVRLARPLPLGPVAILGAGGGLLAVIDTVTLITRRTDFVALAILLTVLIAGHVAARLLLPAGRPGPRARAVAVGLLAAIPIPVIVVLLFLRHANPLGT